MQWRSRWQSKNVTDKCSIRARSVAIGAPACALTVVLAVIVLQVLSGGCETAEVATGDVSFPVAQTLDAQSAFISAVLADAEDYWIEQFDSMDKTYDRPALILFSSMVPMSSGAAVAATGPFYSPDDKAIYIDLGFYKDLQDKYGAGGDAAQSYIVAHEVGHVVQDQLGVLDRVAGQEVGASDESIDQLSMRVELQADFYAGLVARYQGDQTQLNEGAIEKAINAVYAIGDDRLQQQTQGYVVLDSFAHVTLAQRVRWFRLGYETGDFEQGDTFQVPYSEL